jgi:hypothetical protein
MNTKDTSPILANLFSELVNGIGKDADAFMLNPGDIGLLRSLDRISAADASRAAHGGATIAAHTEHVRYGLSLMNRWASSGGNPFATATWGDAWRISAVDDAAWTAIRNGLRDEAQRWLSALSTFRELNEVELTGMVGSVAHLAYHLGAIRQISKELRGPREGTPARSSVRPDQPLRSGEDRRSTPLF